MINFTKASRVLHHQFHQRLTHFIEKWIQSDFIKSRRETHTYTHTHTPFRRFYSFPQKENLSLFFGNKTRNSPVKEPSVIGPLQAIREEIFDCDVNSRAKGKEQGAHIIRHRAFLSDPAKKTFCASVFNLNSNDNHILASFFFFSHYNHNS